MAIGDDKRAEEIRARNDKAWHGPWRAEERGDQGNRYWCVVDYFEELILTADSPEAEFIAHSREDIPWLLDEVKRMTRQLAAISDERDDLLAARDEYGREKVAALAAELAALRAPGVLHIKLDDAMEYRIARVIAAPRSTVTDEHRSIAAAVVAFLQSEEAKQ